MTLFKPFLVASLLAGAALPASAEGIVVSDAYARSSGAMARTGAAFMVIGNPAGTDDRLIAAASDVAQKVELHTHRATADGVMLMVAVPEGFVIPAHGSHALARGGDHIMLLGLTRPLAQGDTIAITLTFETAGEMVVEIPVDLQQQGAMGGMAGHKHGSPGN